MEGLKEQILQLTERFLKDSGVEVWIEFEKGSSIERRDKADFLKENYQEVSVTFRYLKNGKIGLSYATSLDANCLEIAYERAKTLAENGVSGIFPEEKDFPFLSPPPLYFPDLKKVEEEFLSLEEKIFKEFKNIKRIEKLKFSIEEQNLFLLKKDLILSWIQPVYDFFISVVAEGKKEASSYEWVETIDFYEINFWEKAKRACEKARILSQTKKGKSKKCPVILPPEIGVDFLEILSFSFLGDEVIKGRSKLKDKLGKKVFSEKVNIIDSGIEDGLPETRPFDDEGAPQRRRRLVEKGVIKEFIFDTYWGSIARKQGIENAISGNARRPDFTSFPKVSTTNFYVEKGEEDIKEILKHGEFFEVLEVLGTHTADPISGDFSFGASGILYKNGEPVDYFSEVAISGNIFEVFESVIAVEKELTFYANFGIPTLVVEKIDIGG